MYATLEYFAGVAAYRMVEADEESNLGKGSILEKEDFSEWITYTDAANQVFNIAIEYCSYLKNNLMLLSGFKTDFNYNINEETNISNPNKSIKSFNVNYYHFTGGLTLRIKGQDITAGLQYSLVYSNNTKQLVNLSNPVGFNFDEYKALQGIRTNTVKTVNNSFTLLVAAAFNFGGIPKK